MFPPFKRAGEVADIFSDLNFGVIEIAKRIIDLAVVTIIIEGRDNQPAVPGGGRPAQLHQDKPKALPGPVAITK